MSSTTSFPWRSVSRSGHRSRRPASKGWESFELGHRTADLRHRLGARCSQRPFKAKETGEEGEQVGEQRFKFRRGRFSGAAAKEMARRGYRWRIECRKEKRKEGQERWVYSSHQEQQSEEGGERQRSKCAGHHSWNGGRDRSIENFSGSATDRSFEERSTTSSPSSHQIRFEPIIKGEFFKQRFESEQPLASTSQDRTCQGHRKLSSIQETDVSPSLASHQEVRQGGRTGIGSRGRQALQSDRHGSKGELGQTTQSSALPFSPIRHLGKAPQRQNRRRDTSSGFGIKGCASGCDRWRMDGGMDAHTPPRRVEQEAMGWRPRRLRERCQLSSFDAGVEQKHGTASQFSQQQHSGSSRPSSPQKTKTKRKGKGEGRGKDRGSIDLGTAKSGNNSLLEALLKGHGSFSRFLHIMHEMSNVGPGPRTPSDSIKGGSSHIFPSLLVTPSECQANSSRRNHRRRGRADTWKQVEVVWNYFNFLEGGSPYSRHDQVSLAKRCSMTVWTSKHSTYAGFLHDEIHKFGRLSENDSLGRGLEELNKMVSIIRNSQYSPGPYTVEELQSTARPVQPARMSLPEVAGIIDPVDHLKHEHLESFLQMPQTVPHDVPPESPTKGCFKVNPEDVVEVYTKLLDSGVATLIPESQALRNSQGEIISGGLFAVPHKTDTDRIICDRRPMNELERRLIWAKLPHGCLLTQIILPKECSIRGSGDDLSNYFYLLRHRPEWIHRNCVGKVVSGRGFEKYGVDADKNYVLAFTVIPMGDLNAVDIAQQTHLEILKDSGCMQPHEVLSYGHPLPAEQCLEGLYIDDHITMQIVPKKKFGRTAKSRYRDNEIVYLSQRKRLLTSKQSSRLGARRLTATRGELGLLLWNWNSCPRWSLRYAI